MELENINVMKQEFDKRERILSYKEEKILNFYK